MYALESKEKPKGCFHTIRRFLVFGIGAIALLIACGVILSVFGGDDANTPTQTRGTDSLAVAASTTPESGADAPVSTVVATATATPVEPTVEADSGEEVLLAAPTPTPIPVQPTATLAHIDTPTSAPIAQELGTMTVSFLDVGQGDSILLQGADFTILIDAGRHDREDVVPQLEEHGVESIDLLVGTHPHADHIGQFPQVLDRYPVAEVWMSGDTNTTQIFEDTLDAIAETGAGYHEPRAGEVYQIGLARLEVVYPNQVTGDINDGSIVLRVVFGDVVFLFTGDAEASSEQAMLASGRDLHAQILKLGHHGSDTSSTLGFLQAVDPEVAIWSAAKDNEYGHPHASVIERLTSLGIPVFGTATEGSIVVCTNGQTYKMSACDAGEPSFAVDSTSVIAETTLPPTLTPTPTAFATLATGCAPGQININTASYEELLAIIEIGPVRASEMLELRPFISVDDMERINGIGPARLSSIKNQGLACVEDAASTEPVAEPEVSRNAQQVQPPGTDTNDDANLRSGPGTEYPVAGSSPAGQPLLIVAQNMAGDWLKLDSGLWIARFLVNGTDGMTWPIDNTQPAIEVPGPVVEATAPQVVDPTPVVAVPTPVVVEQPPAASQCDPSYPDVCIPPKSVVGDLDCGDIRQFARFRVLQPDPHGFDGNDNDGLGCESN